MDSKPSILILTLAILIPGTVRTAMTQDDDPTIEDKPLSYWTKQLRSDNRGFQLRAAQVLSKVPAEAIPKIVPKLVPLLKSERENDRFVAAQTLGNYGPPARIAVPDLIPLLQGTQYERNRAAAAKAMGQILKDAQPGEEIDKVTQVLTVKFNEEYDPYCDVRREAVRALGMIGPAAKACIPRLVKPLGDEDAMVRQQASWTCGQMGPLAAEHMDTLIALMHREWTPEHVEAMGKIGPIRDNVVANIVDRMEIAANSGWSSGTDMALWPWGSAAMKALQRFGPKAAPALPFLVRLLPDKSGSDTVDIRARLVVLAAAARTVGAMGPAAKAALPRLEVMTTFRNHPHGDNSPALLNDLHEAAKEAVAAVKGESQAAAGKHTQEKTDR